MANVISNTFKGMLLKGQMSLTDSYKIILMQDGFTFNNATDFAYANISASELATAYGYTAGGIALTGATVTVDQSSGAAKLAWTNAQFNASGGSLVTSGAIIYNDSTATGDGDDYTDAIVMYIDAGGTLVATDGTPLIVHDIYLTIN
jgi:hypothetical protein